MPNRTTPQPWVGCVVRRLLRERRQTPDEMLADIREGRTLVTEAVAAELARLKGLAARSKSTKK